MRLKMWILWIFLVIFMFPAINLSWAFDSVPRSRTPNSYRHEKGNYEGASSQRGSINHNAINRRYEKAQRQVRADGKLDYRETRWLHQSRNRVGKGIKRDQGINRGYNRGYIPNRHKQPIFPRFSIGISFPWIH
jgi:hypothetical protein